jgi:hypothetical protein
MRANVLLRWGGLSALLCGVIGIGGEIGFFFAVGQRPYSVAAPTIQWLVLLLLMLASTILGMLGLTALYARQSQNAGRLGLISFVIAAIGTMMHFGHLWSATFVTPVLAAGAPNFLEAMLADTTTQLAAGVLLTWLLMAAGWLLFGIASLRARVLPNGSAWVVTLGAILSLVLSLIGISLDGVVLYIGLVWMGVWLWSERPQA